VNIVSEEQWIHCNGTWNDKDKPVFGDYEFGPATEGPTTLTEGIHYFACGVGDGWHCGQGVKAKITITSGFCPGKQKQICA